MRVLVLGGTSFVGRAIVDHALSVGAQVSTFNRGRTGPDDPRVEVIRGDRASDDGLAALAGRRFDVTIDPGGIVPRHVLRSARLLAAQSDLYVYVSSVSVYRDWKHRPVDEAAPTFVGQPHQDGDPADLRDYERWKAGCEAAVMKAVGEGASLILRPGTVVGRCDNVGHLPWWLERVRRGGKVLCPGDPRLGLQLLDVRDLASFTVHRATNRAAGIFNVVPDVQNVTMGELLSDCVAITNGAAELVWMDDDCLISNDVKPWNELPFWLPPDESTTGAWHVVGVSAAAAGLRCRPVKETLEDTWQWLRRGGEVRLMPGLSPPGISPDRERRLLTTFKG